MTYLLLHLYIFMLKRYPSQFYAEYGEEMAEVFAEKLQNMPDNLAVLAAFGRELRHWPSSCIREHWAVRQAYQPFVINEKMSWRGTAVAALPYLLMALLFAIVYFVAGASNSEFINPTIYNNGLSVLIGIFAITLLIAWWRHWPNWSVSWIGFLAFIIFYVFLPQLIVQIQFASGASPSLLQTMIFDIVVLLLPVGVFYWLIGRWPCAGAIALLAPIGFASRLYLGFVPQHVSTLIFVLTWGWLAVVSVMMMRLGNGRWHGWLLGLATLVIGLISLPSAQYLLPPDMNLNIAQSTASASGMGQNMMSGTGRIAMSNTDIAVQHWSNFLSNYGGTVLPLVAILLFHALRRWAVANGRLALRGYRLLLMGTVFVLLPIQTMVHFILPPNSISNLIGASVGLTAVLGLGLLAIGWGSIVLRRSRRSQQLANGKQIWLLILLASVIPLVFQMETISMLLLELPSIRAWALPHDLAIYQTVQVVGQSVGLLWFGIAAWLLGQGSPPLPNAPKETAVSAPS